MAHELMQTAEAQTALAAVGRGFDPSKIEVEATLTGGLSEEKLRELLGDLRNEIAWRRESDIDCDYFDHRQLSRENLDQLEEWGLPPAMADIIHPTVTAVLGMQAQNRTDWQVDFEEDRDELVAKALGKRLHDEERKTRADRALSEAYAGQVKAGLHWIEVNRESNPFAPSRYRVHDVHRREIWWDWRAKRPDLKDGRYKVRRQWYDIDFLVQLLPHMKDIIEASFSNWGALDDIINEGAIASDRFGAAWDRERELSLDDEEWRDTSRRRAVLFEIWYRVWKRGVIARIGERVVKLSLKNPAHVALIAAGKLQPEIAVYPEMRLSFWIGPHRVLDQPSPLPHDDDPYTPFWGFRADADKAPYGMIRGMRWPQDEVNTRLSKMLSLLTSKRVVMEATAINPAVMDHDEMRRELSQHTAMITVADGALTKRRFVVEENQQLTAQQFSVYQEMKRLISEVSNIYAPMLGREGSQSGVAIDQLVQQGVTSLAEVNDNFSFGQREVGEQLMSFIMDDTQGETTVKVGDKPNALGIVLNKRLPDGRLENAVRYASVKVSLSEVPQTATYRQRVFTMIAEAVKSVPPQMQAVLAPMMIEMSNLPGRKEAARFLRQQLGIPDPNALPGQEDPAAAAAAAQFQPVIEQLQQQLQEAQQQLQQAGAELADTRAEREAKAKEADAKLVDANGKAFEAKARGEAEITRANAEAGGMSPDLMKALAQAVGQAVNQAVAPLVKEVATLQGRVEAIKQR